MIDRFLLLRVAMAVRARTIKALVRDEREPGRKEKEKFDKKLARLVRRHFDLQAERLRQALEDRYSDRKAVADIPNMDDFIEWDDPDFEKDLIVLLTAAAKDGVILFQNAVVQALDYELINQLAADWAKNYVGNLIKGIDETTRQKVRDAIAKFVETPGMTIGDVMDLLPFGEARSLLIAVSEITQAYASANQIAGEELADAYPDVRVTKTWNTNNDSLVCDICAPLDGKEVDINDEFAPGISNPGDSHPGCRCWTTVGTRIIDE